MERIARLVRPNILALQAYSSARSEFDGQAEVFLDANENPFGDSLNRYPDPLQQELKAVIAQQKGVAVEQLFLGNGSDEAIDLLIRIFCRPNQDHIITLPPSYGMYQVSAAISAIEVKEIALLSGFQPDVDQILATATPASKLLFLCSPNNPTGNDFDWDSILRLLDNFPGIVVVDEAYIDFSKQTSCLELLHQYPKLVVLQTFSKAWGLAGIRLGMAFASKYIVGLFNKVKPPYNVNRLTQQAALEKLNDSIAQEAIIATLLVERRRLREALNQLPFVKEVFPSAANFLLIKMEEPDRCYRFLADHQIIVRNRSKVKQCEGCLRITVGQVIENDRLLSVLELFKNKLTA